MKTDDLTPSEKRVAVLAAQGKRNKEIAAVTNLTVGSVEQYLSHVYSKTGVDGRYGLMASYSQGTIKEPE